MPEDDDDLYDEEFDFVDDDEFDEDEEEESDEEEEAVAKKKAPKRKKAAPRKKAKSAKKSSKTTSRKKAAPKRDPEELPFEELKSDEQETEEVPLAEAEEALDEFGRPEPVANYVVHVYEHRKLKRTIDRDFTPEDAEAFATDYNRYARAYGRLAVAGKKDTPPKKSVEMPSQPVA